MSVNKQTVWLVTMLSIMVVLSAYYIVTGPVEPVSQATKQVEQAATGIDVDIKPIDQPGQSSGSKEMLNKKEEDDYFIGYQLQRSTLRQKMVEDYMKIITDPDAAETDLKEANRKIEELMKVDNAETVLEELIRKEGFRDAVVVSNRPQIDVIVQTEQLSKAQVVKLVSLVKQHFDVSPLNVSVAYRK